MKTQIIYNTLKEEAKWEEWKNKEWRRKKIQENETWKYDDKKN